MVTMVDEIYDRHYQDARNELNAALARGAARLGNAISNAFRVLNRIEYDSPWTARAKHVR
ncbi:MAG TPA: hypothetical protein VE820_13420 [Sphingomicrobium sp.]|nr:hypothetical protein [Sphingomicrobium sp.]